MQEIKIKFDFSHGPIWKERYDAMTGRWSTGIAVIDNDSMLDELNYEAEKEYASLYSFDEQGGVFFNQEEFGHKKSVLLYLVQAIISRMDELNDGTFKVINEEQALTDCQAGCQ